MPGLIVAGSFPPIPVPAAKATVGAVRRAIEAGDSPIVVSPRPSAAHYSVPLTGVFAGRRLNRMRARTGADRLVFCVEPGVPFAPPGRRGPLRALSAVLTAFFLARAVRGFARSTLIVTGETGAPSRAMRMLRRATAEVLEDIQEGGPPAGVTTRGPKELRLRDRARVITAGVARRVLGQRLASSVRAGWLAPVVLLVVVFAVDVASPSGMTADSIRQASVAVAMVHFHTIGLDHLMAYQVNPHAAVTIVHGHTYPYFPWGGALFAVPWVVGYDIAHKAGIGPGSIGLIKQHHDWALQVLSMSTVVAVTTVVVYFIALRVLTIEPLRRRRRWAFGSALVFAFCTPAWSTASRSMWEHGPSMLFVALAVLFALRARDGLAGWTGLGVSLGCAYAVRPTDALPVIVLGLWVLLFHTRKLVNVVLGAIPPLGILVGVDLVAYRQLLTPYYTQGSSFSLTSTFPKALAGNLVSPGRGLLIYVPLVVASAAGLVVLRRQRRLDPLWIALAVVPLTHWILISAFKHWWGGDSYGPRLFTDMMPIFAVLAVPAADRLAGIRFNGRRLLSGLLTVAIAWSFLVHAQGATLRSAWCWNNEPTDVDTHPSKVWSWSDPQFARGIRTLIWGPNRHSELVRDGVDRIGCPVEAINP